MSQIVAETGLPMSKLEDVLGQAPTLNSRNNIIAGPEFMDYWNHTPGFEKALIKSEAAFPMQGAIGNLVANQGNDFKSCGTSSNGQAIPDIGSSPNCSGSFKPDMYQLKDTCGEECFLKYPQSFGDKSFGFDPKAPWQSKVSDSHQIHAYKNMRAAMPGQGPSSVGPYEWLPRASKNPPTNSIVMNPEPVYDQVGNFLNLPQYSNLRYANFRD
jgi:hypothetical protein